jgi:hypothetical protein
MVFYDVEVYRQGRRDILHRIIGTRPCSLCFDPFQGLELQTQYF